MGRVDRVARAGLAGYVAAAAGGVALVTIALFFTFGQPFGSLNDLSLVVMTLALAPMMLGFYELGGRTPITLAQVSLAAGVVGVVTWSLITLAMVLGPVGFDYSRAATGAFAVSCVAMLVIGAWLIGANALAGSWLPPIVRWLGLIAGVGFALTGLGLLLGGVNQPLTYAGGVGYQLVFPLWALLLGRALRGRVRSEGT